MNFAVISYVVFLCILYLCVKSNAKRNWQYEMLYFNIESSDDNLVNATSKIDYGELGNQSFSATVDWKYDTDENMKTEMKVYSCQSGRDGDYRELPYAIPSMSFYEFMDQYYMKFVYYELASCSNLPGFEKFTPPWNKTLYIFTKCRPEGKTMPEILPRGYYRLVMTLSGQADLIYTVIYRLTTAGLISSNLN